MFIYEYKRINWTDTHKIFIEFEGRVKVEILIFNKMSENGSQLFITTKWLI